MPSLGINYQLAIDGMSLLLVLLTSIIIFAGVFASWTVKERGQEFYALLLLLVTGVFGVFVSLDLFVFFLFYEIAVLPMYLLIGIWGSTGEVRPQGIFGWAFGRTGVGTKEYAAMKLTLYLLFGSAFILVGILALYVGGGSTTFSFLELQQVQFDRELQSWVFLAFYVGFGDPRRHLAAAHLVARRPRLGAHRRVDAARRRADEARRLRRRAPRHGPAPRRARSTGRGWSARSPASTSSTARSSAMAQTDLKYVIAYSSVSHMGVVMLGVATLTESRAERRGLPDVRARHHDRPLLRARRPGLREGALARDLQRWAASATMMPGIATAFTIGGSLVARAARDRRLRRRVPDVPRRLAVRASRGGCSPA